MTKYFGITDCRWLFPEIVFPCGFTVVGIDISTGSHTFYKTWEETL